MAKPKHQAPPGRGVLIIEDDEAFAGSLAVVLRDEGWEVALCGDGSEGFARALEEDFAVVVTDFRLPGMGGMELLERLRGERPELPVLLMTSHGTAELAIRATKGGAFDYLIKPFDLDELLRAIRRAADSWRASALPVRLPGEGRGGDAGMIGSGRAMQDVCKEIGRVAPTDAGVLITGETGTGKELVARAIFQHSRRAHRPFIAVNCGAIPENLLESELFGYRKGAFTGAVADRRGRFEQAGGGTLFLDEIGEMPASLQVKLLRVLQERKVQPLGAGGEVAIDVRVIAATNRDLGQEVAEGRFRADLLYRLNAVEIALPPLRERAEDIAELVASFNAQGASEFGVPPAQFPKDSIGLLENAAWPGNIRQLENVVRRLVLAARGGAVAAVDVEAELARSGERGGGPRGGGDGLADLAAAALDEAEAGGGEAHRIVIEEVERELFEQALERCGGNQSRAANLLGLSRVTLRAKLRKHGIAAGRK